MEALKRLCDFLADPNHVAKFQEMCGIEHAKITNPQSPTTLYPASNTLEHSTVSRINGDVIKRNGIIRNGRCKNLTEDRNENDKCVPNGYCDAPLSDIVFSEMKDRTKRKISPEDNHLVKNKILYWFFKAASILGNENFYLVFFPVVMWNFDAVVSRRVAIVWCTIMYLGQATKDCLNWPRPPSPPVTKLESSYVYESSMPSTHAMGGTALPLAIAYSVINRYEIPPAIVIGLALLWFVSLCLSRLYLGVHTILDIICGILYAGSISLALLPYLDEIDWYQQTYLFAPLLTLPTSFTLSMWFYPKPKNGKKNAKGAAVKTVAGTVGFFFGAWLNYQMGTSSFVERQSLYPYPTITFQWIYLSVIRSITGGAIIALTDLCLKFVTVRITSKLIGLDKPDERHPFVMPMYKFITYLAVGFVITHTVPCLHKHLNILRPTFYSEML